MFWAWERPGDLKGLPERAGVAFLASSIFFEKPGIRVVPRFQPVEVSAGTFRMAVIRIETRREPVTPSESQRKRAVEVIAETARITQADALQVDFDARASERAFYRALLEELRARLGPGMFLSMTALVSWCGAPSWLDGVPVDEVVPMTFEMGAGRGPAETLLASGGQFANPRCRASIGISVPDLPRRPRGSERTYVFAYEDWTGGTTRSVLARFR